MKKVNDSYLREILDNHADTKGIRIFSKEPFTKEYAIEKLKVTEDLHIGQARFVKLKQIYQLKCKKVGLTLTNLKELHFIKLVDDLKTGWTPGWRSLFVDFSAEISLDSVIEQPIVEMEDPLNLKEFDKSSPRLSYRFKSEIEATFSHSNAVGFHKVREDGSILTVTVLNNVVAQILIHPADTKVLEVFSDPAE